MPYKIVREWFMQELGYPGGRKGFTSLYASTGSVQYKVGKPTGRPKGCGPLAAFNSFKDAMSFCSSYRYPIFRCKVKEYEGKRRALWEMDRCTGKRRTLSGSRFPLGTILCDEITLTIRVA